MKLWACQCLGLTFALCIPSAQQRDWQGMWSGLVEWIRVKDQMKKLFNNHSGRLTRTTSSHGPFLKLGSSLYFLWKQGNQGRSWFGTGNVYRTLFPFFLQESAAVMKAMPLTRFTDTCVCAVTGDRAKGEWQRTLGQRQWLVFLREAPNSSTKRTFSLQQLYSCKTWWEVNPVSHWITCWY